jgi:hypothetical protein
MTLYYVWLANFAEFSALSSAMCSIALLFKLLQQASNIAFLFMAS